MGGVLNSHPNALRFQRGVSLIELVVFIVVVGIAVAGVSQIMVRVMGHSADALLRKQALAIAESLLEEAELMPFSFCDPDDASAASAVDATVGANSCTATVEALGPETIFGVTETRYGGAASNAQFDNVSDYHGFTMNAASGGILDVTGSAIAALNRYSAAINISEQGMAATAGAPAIAATDALRITVTVTAPDNSQVVLDGYRTRYSPRSLP
ncbi:MAG: type II secretion system protein [Nitrosomonadales bacterium]|nr:type II secretion system protein [Nitrosomonadales bacterium]